MASDMWKEQPALPVPPREVTKRGTRSVFQFVKAALQGGSFIFSSCRVMVVGPQMVRFHSLLYLSISDLDFAAGWEDQPDQCSEKRHV